MWIGTDQSSISQSQVSWNGTLMSAATGFWGFLASSSSLLLS